MLKIAGTAIIVVLTTHSLAASAWWGEQGLRDAFGRSFGEFSMSMSFSGSGRGWGRGWNRQYDYYGPYGYQNYGDGATRYTDALKPVAPKAPAAATQ